MNYSQQKSVRYLGWSRHGNGDAWKDLDLVNDWAGNSLTECYEHNAPT